MHTDQDNFTPDILELCLDICTPATLAALALDHADYIAKHQNETDAEKWGALDMLNQDHQLIIQHLTDTHFGGIGSDAFDYISQCEKTHIPF